MARKERNPIVTRPTREQIAAAHGRTIPDVITDGLDLLFCGINPSLYSAAVGHHFARPGNRFWPVLHAAGFTNAIVSPFDDRKLLAIGCGLTNVVARATGSADELTPDELMKGARRLMRKVQKYRPVWVAFLGTSAYRVAFARPHAQVGPQQERIADSRVWVLPNPSGLNAHYPPTRLAVLFAELRAAINDERGTGWPFGR
jgi:double-stranded uracil-DNA glycosylase